MDREEGELLVVHTEEESLAIGHLVRPIEHQMAIVHRDLALRDDERSRSRIAPRAVEPLLVGAQVPGPVDARPSQRQLTAQGVTRSGVVHAHRPYGRLWLWRPRAPAACS